MSRTITVKGTGRATAKPDLVILKITLETLYFDYMKCMKLAEERSRILLAAFKKNSFKAEDVKTADFHIRQEYHYGKNSEKIMDGWKCTQVLKVEFPLDVIRMKEILGSVVSCGVQFELSIDFTVSDGNALQEEMLADAARNARKKAETLCAASGAKLGDLLAINYSWGELNIYSHTDYEEDINEDRIRFCTMEAPDITPEDIDVKDTATFVWAIE